MPDACVVQESYGHTLGYGLTMVAALSELAPVLHVKTFQQERGDSFSCGIWATWNKTILDWYIELEVQVTLRDIQNPPPAPADLMLLAFRILEAGDLLNDDESPASFGLADLTKEALLHQGFVHVPQMTSCMDEWITEHRLSAHCYRLPLISSTQASGQRQCSARRPQSACGAPRRLRQPSARRPSWRSARLTGTPPEGVAEGQRNCCLVAQT